MRTVVLETPFAGDVERNIKYARACLKDCLLRGEAPFASHILYTQDGVLDDNDLGERATGIAAGLAIGAKLDATVVYTDLGISIGVKAGIDRAVLENRIVEYRTLSGWKP